MKIIQSFNDLVIERFAAKNVDAQSICMYNKQHFVSLLGLATKSTGTILVMLNMIR